MPRVEVEQFEGVRSAALNAFWVWSGRDEVWVIVPRPFSVQAFHDDERWGIAIDVSVEPSQDHVATRQITALAGYPLLTHRRLQDLPLKAILAEAITRACVRVEPGPSTHARNVWVEAGEPVSSEIADAMLTGTGRAPSASRRRFEEEFIRNEWQVRRGTHAGGKWYEEVGRKIGISSSTVYNLAVEMGLTSKRPGKPRGKASGKPDR